MGVWVVRWMDGSVGQWMGSGQITKSLINPDLIEIIQFYLKFMICDVTPGMDGCVGDWMDGWVDVWVMLNH